MNHGATSKRAKAIDGGEDAVKAATPAAGFEAVKGAVSEAVQADPAAGDKADQRVAGRRLPTAASFSQGVLRPATRALPMGKEALW